MRHDHTYDHNHIVAIILCSPVAGMTWITAAIRAAGIERTLNAGQTLFRLDSRVAGLYEVVSGKIRLVRVSPAGSEAVLFVATASDTLAEASLFSTTYHCDAIASTKATVRLYPKAAVLAEFQRNPKVAQAFMAMLAQQVMSLRTGLQRRNIRSARDRVRHYLALNVGADKRTIVLTTTIKDLARDLGLTHEALYRTLSEMASDGEIKRSDRKITIRAANRLSPLP
jgi:CRP/FNR family transcriptional regulator, dissimilatory nitrate respiration regulator